MSFADGFRSGFGLISDVQDRALQRDRLDEQARQGDLDRESTAAYRKAQTDNADELARIRRLEAENKETASGISQTKSDAMSGY